MHHLGFAMLIWTVDIIGALAVLRLAYMLMSWTASMTRMWRLAGVRPRWVAHRELAILMAWNVVGTVVALMALRHLFGAPRWLALVGA